MEILDLPTSSEKSIFTMFNLETVSVDPIDKLIDKNFSVPITFFYGALDWMDPTGAFDLLQKLGLEKCKIMLLPLCGH